MATRSLNKVILIGNLTRDPELRYTPSGTGVCTFGLATNRSWTTQTGEMKEDAEFHRIVAWNKLAELCSQLLTKGRKIYVEGRLSTHSWTAQDGTQRTSTEVVIEDMIILDSKRTAPAADAMNAEGAKPSGNYPAETASSQGGAADAIPEEKPGETVEPVKQRKSSRKSAVKTEASVPNEESQKTAPEAGTDDITPDDIPF